MHILQAAIARAERIPHEPAVCSAETVLSWREFVDTAARIATFFDRSGVTPGHVVAISSAFSPIMQTVLIAATWYRGAISCNAHDQLIAAPPCEFDWVITPHSITSHTPQIVIDQQALTRISQLTPQPSPTPYSSRDAVCRLVFSSGTTGRPKAIAYSVERLRERVLVARDQWITERPFMTILGLSTASGTLTFAECLRSGMPYLVPGTPEQNVHLLSTHRVRGVHSSPAQLAELARALDRAAIGTVSGSGTVLPHMTLIESTGSSLPNKLRAQLAAHTAAKIVNFYGSSEVGFVARSDVSDSTSGLVGKIFDHVEVQIMNEAGIPLPEATPGIIRVRRLGQPNEYFHRRGSTDEVVEKNSEQTQAFHDGWFYPGDLGWVVDGNLYLRGRRGEVINVSGAKFVATELEQRILLLTDVEDVAVFVKADEHGVERIVAAFTGPVELGAPASLKSLKSQLGDGTPTQAVRVQKIPRNQNGKIDRQQLQNVLPG